MPRRKLKTRKHLTRRVTVPSVRAPDALLVELGQHREGRPLKAKKLELIDALVSTIYRQSDTPVSDLISLGTALASAGFALKEEEHPTEIWAFVQTILALKQS
jgi:hypothetical protein